MNLLSEIVDVRKQTFERRFSVEKLHILKNKISMLEHPRDFFSAISNEFGWGIIAEIKAKSPSKGVLLKNPDPDYWGELYYDAGARSISIVTEENYFNGDAGWIQAVKKVCPLPILRKDFFTTQEEILESRAVGADAVLLIAAILGRENLSALVEKAFDLDLEPLVEVHTIEEARMAMETKARVIGVNNRNLHDFSVNTDITKKLLPFLHGRCVVSESGFGAPKELEVLHKLGVKAFLIGETFLTSMNPLDTVKQFVFSRQAGSL